MCRQKLANLLARLPANRESYRPPVTFANDQLQVPKHRTFIAVFVGTSSGAAPAVIAVGLVRKGRGDTDVDTVFKADRLFRMQPAPSVGTLRAKLRRGFKDVLDTDDLLSEARSILLTEALAAASREIAGHLEDLRSELEAEWPTGEPAERLGLEKDAVGSLLEIAGFDRAILRSWRPTAEAVNSPFVAGMPEEDSYEDQMIIRDSHVFPDWLRAPIHGIQGKIDWRAFVRRGGQDQLLIANVNTHEGEAALGTDMMYFNLRHDCFVLVQYKKMKKQKRTNEWGYIPHGNIYEQLERMRRIDEKCEPAPDGDYPYRFVAQPSWLKLIEPRLLEMETNELSRGMYLPRAAFQHLLDDPDVHGPNGGKWIGYTNTPRYLNNTNFTGLVGDGWIGTVSAGTDFILEQLDLSRAAGHTAILGVHRTEHIPGNGRRRRY
jgi:hypothetical protein